jgi:REP element-mobilizing transposase RayT
LKGYDYSQGGAYFITICVQGGKSLFGSVVDGKMELNDAGKMIRTVWGELPEFYKQVEIDEFSVMPNHVHGILVIVGAGPRACPDCQNLGQPRGVAPTMSLSDVVRNFKTMTTKRYVDGVKNNEFPPFYKRLWQRNYYEHIIRNDESLGKIREYVLTNPECWPTDELYKE